MESRPPRRPAGGLRAQQAPAPPPPAVKVATVLQQDVPVYLEAIGEARGNTEIEIRARVAGYLETVDFKEGTLVSKGQRLYTIDSRPFEAELAQARGQLAEAEAQLARARQDVVRYEPLVAKNAISRQEYETAVALEKAAAAAVDAAKATVEQAQIQLGYTTVLAPADGLIGKHRGLPRHARRAGQQHAADADLAHRSDPRPLQPGREGLPLLLPPPRGAEADARRDCRDLPVRLVLADGSELPATGRLVFVDRDVDATTGTIMVEAAFPNPDFMVRPGQYGRIRATASVKQGAILVPQRAVSGDAGGLQRRDRRRRTTRSRRASSRRPSAWARCG